MRIEWINLVFENIMDMCVQTTPIINIIIYEIIKYVIKINNSLFYICRYLILCFKVIGIKYIVTRSIVSKIIITSFDNTVESFISI